MRTIKFFAIAAAAMLMIQSCGNNPTTPQQTPAKQLLSRLETLRQKGVMFGHQDDPMYGLTWAYDKDSSDVKNVCGDYPAVMGFDLGGIEIADKANLDSVPFTRITEEIKNHHRRGGIITISWHPRNPQTTIEGGGRAGQKFPEGTAWDVTDTMIVSKILPGGSLNGVFNTWMQRVSDFLKTLTDDNGNKIPVIFRPWHENSGSWFWWGEKFCTPDQYRALWNMLQDKLKADGHNNLVWSYSPGMEPNLTEQRLLERYPGDDRTDMIGLDGYQWTPDAEAKQQFIDRGRQNLEILCKVAKEHNLIPALTECGLKNLTEPTWWTSTLMPTIDGFPISYLLVWRNYKSEWFGPAPSKPDAEYFREYYKSDKSLFVSDIK